MVSTPRIIHSNNMKRNKLNSTATVHRKPRFRTRQTGSLALSLSCSLALLGCGSSSGISVDSQLPSGAFGPKPDGGGTYISDPLLDPGGTRLGLVKVVWGRLVDIHDLDSQGAVETEPVFHDMVVRQELATDGVDYIFEVDPVTQVTRLIVLRDAEAADTAPFRDLVLAATEGLPEIDPKRDDGASPPPFSLVPNNATMLLCFDDMLQDDAATEAMLDDLVRVRTGYTPTQPFDSRIIFERNFGAVQGGRYHSTRIIVDSSVSELEAQQDSSLVENAFGLPASLTSTNEASFSLRIPTEIDQSVGQFDVLTNLRGRPLDVAANGPTDLTDPRLPIIRGLRAGNDLDPQRGFLIDNVNPQLLGTFGATVDAVRQDPAGGPLDLLVDMTFVTACQLAPLRGDVLESPGAPLQVSAGGATPDTSGHVYDLKVHALFAFESTADFMGGATYVTPFNEVNGIDQGCWASFQPAATGPGQGVSPDAVVSLRFSEAMGPQAIEALDGPALVRGEEELHATSIAPSLIQLDPGLREVELVPVVSLLHAGGGAEPWRIPIDEVSDGLRDLAGNELARAPDAIRFTLDPSAPASNAGGVVLRLKSNNEYNEFDQGVSYQDLRGHIVLDVESGIATPRPVQRQAWPVDQSQFLPSQMFALPVSIQEPLVPLGSKLQTLWRYADLGWLITDETRVDLDVEGISWAPFAGSIVSDFYKGFEILLGHSSRLPDESLNMGALVYPNSGLQFQGLFDDNLVPGRTGLSESVHPTASGYLVDPTDAYTAASGTKMAPFPLNRQGATAQTFTWRDTTVLSVGGAEGPGIPLEIEVVNGIYPDLFPGELAPGGSVPSIGLPLLMEFRTHTEPTALGLNGFQVAIAQSGQLFPTWRVHSSGGINASGAGVSVDPDLQPTPIGGYDNTGAPTRANDPSLYFGELQTVVRFSRAHSVWFDSGSTNTDWKAPRLIPADASQPTGTSIQLEYRGATSFIGTNNTEANALWMDIYGDVTQGQVMFANGDSSWKSSISELAGARYIQVR
ncbi:MAG: hypothetical protein ACI82F_001951, partial [Planctomycetota bacterium]